MASDDEALKLAGADDAAPAIENGDVRPAIAGLAELGSVVAELREIVAAAHETSSSEALGLAVMLDERLRAVVEELGGRLDTLAAAAPQGDADDLEAKLDGFAARITGPLGVGGVLQAVEGVRSALDLGPQLEAFSARVESSLASSNEQTLDIEQIAAVGREASGELRELVTAAREASSSEVAGLAATLDERLRGVAEELGGRLDALARSAHEGNGDELETKLDGFAARLDGPARNRWRAAGC